MGNGTRPGDNEIIDEELLERLYGLDVKLAG